MAGHILYSTNPHFAFEVARSFMGNRQPVWCCESFDPASIFSESRLTMIGPSSSPRAIAEQLLRSVTMEDQHCPLIDRYRRQFTAWAEEWRKGKRITAEQAHEIKALATQPTFRRWRPLVYLIPRAPIEQSGRLRLVPPERRAAQGAEFEIADLDLQECDILEWR